MNLLPTVGAADPRAACAARWQQWLLYAWVVALVAMPLLLHGVDSGTLLVPEYLIDVRMHAVIELFCGIMALLIAGLILALSRHKQERTLLLFALGFLVMGLLDVVHAITPPDVYPGLFVSAHTLSTLFGGVLFCAGTVLHYRRHRLPGLPLWLSREAAFTLMLLIGLVLAYHIILPVGSLENLYTFSIWAYRAHEFSGVLYAFAALLAFLYYRGTGQRLILVIGAILMLFAESAYLFRFSQMWDSAWWTWHFVKVGLYLGSLVVIAAGLVLSLRAVQRARVVQDNINRQLRVAHDRLDDMNRELQLRNTMVNASIGARSLDQTLEVIENTLAEFVGECRYSLVLRVAEDEVEEFQRGLQRQTLRWNVRVRAEHMPCVRLVQAVGGDDEHTVYSCSRGANGRACMCLTLRAHDEVFGYLRLEIAGGHPEPGRVEQLNVVAAEIGPILYNALLHYRWTQAIGFRAALLRVTAMLGSTLELPRVLEAVCGESAHMLASEASGILLADADGDSGEMRLVSCCMPDTAAGAAVAQPEWIASAAGRELFRQLRESGRPVALVKPETADAPAPFPLGTSGCIWGAVALFPMLEGEQLIAVMLIMRTERIPFSAATLEQGELLAEQVRVALVNARAYEALRDANEQLRRSEQERIRAERLAVLGQMAASVAHEVRNPLSAINNCLAVLRRNIHDSSDSVGPAIEIIDDEVRRLDRLTHNFMSFGRSPRTAAARVHLGGLVARVCERIDQHIQHEGLSVGVEQEVIGGYTPVMFDADGFQEVLWNLMLNAVQAMHGSGRLRVRLNQNGRHAFLAVADDGPGIPPEKRTQIFEPFFSQRSEGAGLGLAIVLQHVEAWGGRLRIWGPPGACFAMRFPVAEAQVADRGVAS
ncbi:multi-sensor signal transduction histidine kinase [Thiohalobacter thiocyanaticus]|uniref:histidine kinase n=1 Tax=Thiohalobacter thiocyanaticus TaxID=585455 RepID=A0A1Z4VND2_9GAMM|nr:ATP-binding protein [Thiohalobacter thiocyanaticus]BAZ92942.1 multi-sensor signal transduction histidine kinase [Thiohalobacter thiocyanaticus]